MCIWTCTDKCHTGDLAARHQLCAKQNSAKRQCGVSATHNKLKSLGLQLLPYWVCCMSSVTSRHGPCMQSLRKVPTPPAIANTDRSIYCPAPGIFPLSKYSLPTKHCLQKSVVMQGKIKAPSTSVIANTDGGIHCQAHSLPAMKYSLATR